MAGDYTKFQRHYTNLTTDFEITALMVNPSVVLPVRNGNYQVFIQSAEVIVTTYAIGAIKLVGVSSGRVYATFNIPASPSSNNTDIFRLDYGPTGLGVNIGESVQVSWANSMVDAILHIEAYQKQAKTVGANDSPTNQ